MRVGACSIFGAMLELQICLSVAVRMVASVLQISKRLRKSSHFKVVAQRRRSVVVIYIDGSDKRWWHDNVSGHNEQWLRQSD